MRGFDRRSALRVGDDTPDVARSTAMAGRVEGKVALVTGGGAGIGRATALAFAREGARVAVADINGQDAEETARLITSTGAEALFAATDVSRAAGVEALVATTVTTFGRLDCAFNNAGVNEEHGPLADCTEAEWDRILAVNLKGIWLCMKYEIPEILRVGGGAIVNTASVLGLVGSRGTPAYVASKHGIIGLTKAAARDYGQAHLRVNAVCPGTIQTPMYVRREGDDPERDARRAAAIPLGRLGQSEDVAEAVVLLCSDAAAYVTGATLVVDGGDIA
jgi:NAD(P)-dependent dehydrogenase (short-subunit alcohol dehydrogenase family)